MKNKKIIIKDNVLIKYSKKYLSVETYTSDFDLINIEANGETYEAAYKNSKYIEPNTVFRKINGCFYIKFAKEFMFNLHKINNIDKNKIL